MPKQDAIPVPPSLPPEDFGTCEFCEDPATLREQIQVRSGMPTDLYVYACVSHKDNAYRLARARIGPKPK